jgi:uncharacterized delta-60 repeat protein
MAAQVLFVDPILPDLDLLLDVLPAGLEIQLLAPGPDAFEQMAAWLQENGEVEAVHVVSHGAPGELQLGGRRYDAAALEEQAAVLTRIGQSLTDTGDILLYGCEVGAGAAGLAFLDTLAELTGAEVAASVDPTGAGGDWQLESVTGPIEAKTVLDAATAYAHTLANRAPRVTAAGTLDASFSGDGKLTTYFVNTFTDDNASGVAVAPTGKIVVAGYSAEKFAVARYLMNGNLDTTFDGDGKVLTAVSAILWPNDRAYSVLVQPNGRVVVGGDTWTGVDFDHDFALVRYNGDGSLDTTFGGDGKVTTSFSNDEDWIRAMALQADGKIVAVGRSLYPNVLVRYTADGSLDASFDGDGRVATPINPRAVAMQADGRILVGGTLSEQFAVTRYNADGSLDTGFGGDGTVNTEIVAGAEASVSSIAVQADGRILVAGSVGYGEGLADFALARFNADGSPDTAFDGDGKLTIGFSFEESGVAGIGVQADGRIVVSGAGRDASGASGFLLARLNVNGSLDTTFSGDGKLVTVFGAEGHYGGSLALMPDGRIVLAGTSAGDFAVARYLPGGIPDLNASAYSGFSFSIPAKTFTDPDGDALTYTATLDGGAALPAWLTFNPVTRVFSGTPSNLDAGALAVRVTATDPGGLSASDPFTLTVSPLHDVVGTAGNDLLYGTPAADTLDGKAGADTLVGREGDDVYVVDNAGDVVTEAAGGGTDLVKSSVSFNFGVVERAQLENLTLTGTAAISGTGNAKANTLVGNGAANLLNGSGGADVIKGVAGNDTVVGRFGLDTLTGGLGADQFKFVKTGEGLDTVTDFSRTQGDKLAFVSPNFGGLPTGTLAASAFVANLTGQASDLAHRFIFETDTRLLWFDADGSGGTPGVDVAKLNVAALVSTDIVIVAA